MTQEREKYRPIHPYGGINAKERMEIRRAAFIDAGIKAFGTNGYVRTTIKDICEIAGLTQRYLYESFEDKEDLLVAVYRKIISDIESEALIIIGQSGISPEDKVRKLIRMFYQLLKEDPCRARVQLFEVLGVSARVDDEYRAGMSKLSDWVGFIIVCVFPEIQNKDKESKIIFTGGAGAILQIANQSILGELDMSVEEIVEQLFRILMALGKSLQSNEIGTVI